MAEKRGKHTTFRGTPVDMEAMRAENGNTRAVGNMGINARGDIIEKGLVTKSAEQLARENHRQRVIEKPMPLKGPEKVETKRPVIKKKKEVETPDGDIIVKDDE